MSKPILANNVKLELNRFEFGFLMGLVMKEKDRKDFPETLKLKLDIEFVKAYANFDTLKEQVKEELEAYTKRLKEISEEN